MTEERCPACGVRRGDAELIDQSCRVCASGGQCVYANWSAKYIWVEVEKSLRELSRSTDLVWNCNEQRRILNLMWHYKRVWRE